MNKWLVTVALLATVVAPAGALSQATSGVDAMRPHQRALCVLAITNLPTDMKDRYEPLLLEVGADYLDLEEAQRTAAETSFTNMTQGDPVRVRALVDQCVIAADPGMAKVASGYPFTQAMQCFVLGPKAHADTTKNWTIPHYGRLEFETMLLLEAQGTSPLAMDAVLDLSLLQTSAVQTIPEPQKEAYALCAGEFKTIADAAMEDLGERLTESDPAMKVSWDLWRASLHGGTVALCEAAKAAPGTTFDDLQGLQAFEYVRSTTREAEIERTVVAGAPHFASSLARELLVMADELPAASRSRIARRCENSDGLLRVWAARNGR